MAFQRIRIKNTNVIGKIPGADHLDKAELCINLKDHKLFSKDADGNIFEVGGSVNSGDTPPSSGDNIGDLFWDGDVLLIWNGADWEPVSPVTSVNGEVGDVVLELGNLDDVEVDGAVDEQVLVYSADQGKWVPASAASLAVDVDLGYTAAPDKGTVTNTAGDDADLPLANATNAGLMSPADFEKLEDVAEIGDGTITITQADGTEIGSFTVNQAGDTAIALPADVVPSAPGDGKLTIKDADDNTLGEFTANQPTGSDVEITLPAGFSGDYDDLTNTPVIGDGEITIVDADGGAVGSFTVNQEGGTQITLPEIPEAEGFVKLDDEGTEQSIVGGGGLDVAGGITSEFGTNAAQLGNVAPLNDWSCYPARGTTYYAPPPPAPEPVDPGFGVEQPSFGSGQIISGVASGGLVGTQDIIDLGGE